MKRVSQLKDTVVGPGRGPIDFTWEFHIQSLMRPLGIKFVYERIECFLLLKEVLAGGFGGFFLERQVHAFMAAVFLGVSRLNPFNRDAEPQPPDRQAAHPEERIAGRKRLAIVGTDGVGQSEFFEGSLKDIISSRGRSAVQGFTGQ